MTDEILARYPQVAGQPLKMAALCRLLASHGNPEDAHALGLAAITTAPEDMAVRDLVRAALSKDVPTWHVPMLQDEARNDCYRRAIERMVKPGMRVLDIGTGAGLLALLAARAGAEVVTCESNPMIAAAAREIVRANGFEDRIRVVACSSKKLAVGGDLAAPADLLISEIFHHTLFGEGVVETLSDARKRLLKPGAPVLPPRAALRCALVALPRPAERLLGQVEGFDMSAFNVLARHTADRLRMRALEAEQRSDVFEMLPMDFEAAPFGAAQGYALPLSYGGRVDGVVQWLHIDFGGGVTYENSPFTGTWSHWGAPLFPFATPIETQAGTPVEVGARLFGPQLLIDLARR